jgi:hypothetical protein
VNFSLRTSRDSVLVPDESVKLGQARRSVSVVNNDRTVELRMISGGQRHREFVMVKIIVSIRETVVKTGQLMP